MSLLRPPSAESAAANRVHGMRLARGACWAMAVFLLAAMALTLLDATVPMPDWLRGWALAVWLTLAGAFGWYRVSRQSPQAGQPLQAARLELHGNLAAAATVTVLLLTGLLAALAIPGASGHLRRVTLPWYRPATSLYRVIVRSEETIVRTGEPITLSAYVEKLDPAAELPTNAITICRDSNERETAVDMTDDGHGAFHVTLAAVTENFDYRIAVGGATSDWRSVTVIEAAEPTRQTAIKVFPPTYAADRYARRELSGFVPFSGWQYGRVELALQFSIPVENATLEWGANGSASNQTIAVELAPDHGSGLASMILKSDGLLNLILTTRCRGKDLKTRTSLPVHVEIDHPPVLDWVSGAYSRPMTIRPGTSLLIGLGAHDDYAIDRAVLEYQCDSFDSRTVSIPVTLDRPVPGSAIGKLQFDLPAELRQGESLRYRIRIEDNRRLKDPELQPQVIFYPESGWCQLTLSATARPIAEQEIELQRESIQQVLTLSIQELNAVIEEISAVDHVMTQSLEYHHEVRLKNLREGVKNRLLVTLNRTAANLNLILPLRPLAGSIQTTCDGDLNDLSDLLLQVVADKIKQRTTVFGMAREKATRARQQLERLLQRNSELAQARLDCWRLEELQAAQRALIEQLKPDTRRSPEELVPSQQELKLRLSQIIAGSEPLKRAMAAQKKQAIERLARSATVIAERIEQLNGEIAKAHEDERQSLMAELAVRTRVTSDDIATALKTMEQATRLAALNPPRPDELRVATAALQAGKTIDALAELQRLAESLTAVAKVFEKWSVDRADPKLACRQFILWQEDLRSRYQALVQGQDAGDRALPETTRTAYLREIQAIRLAFESLPLPPGYDLEPARSAVVKQLAAVSVQLKDRGVASGSSLEAAIMAMRKLDEKIPTVPERLTRTRQQFDRLFREQDAIAALVEPIMAKADLSQLAILTTLAKKLNALAPRQLQQIASLSALDWPTEEIRSAPLLAAMTAAAGDLEAGLPYDAFASQQWVRRQFDRQKRVFDRVPQPDEIAEGLVQRLESMLVAIQSHGPIENGDGLASPAEAAQEVYKKLQQLTPTLFPHAATLRNDALIAMKSVLEVGFQEAAKFNERCARLKAAIEAIRALASRLRDQETDLARVQRIAANRAIAAEKAKSISGREPRVPSRVDAGESQAQLVREATELLQTRVGSQCQLLKQRILMRYGQLKTVPEPDHDAKLQRELAELLNEMAGLMADAHELATMPAPRSQQSTRFATGDYLPSAEMAQRLRQLANTQHELRERLNHLAEEWRKSLRKNAAILASELKQQELAREVEQLATRLSRVIENYEVSEEERSRFSHAAREATRCAGELEQAKKHSEKEQWSEAEKDRQHSHESLITITKILAVVPSTEQATTVLPVDRCAESLMEAAEALRCARESLEQKRSVEADRAMHQAMEALKTACEYRRGS